MPKYVLSLDFDGVLHPFGSRGEALFGKMPLIHSFLEQYPAVNVIVHSSWRQIHGAEDIGEMLFRGRPNLMSRYLGVTPVEIMSRWESIEAWVEAHKPTSICVLDDEPRLFPGRVTSGQEPGVCFIECPTTHGLAENHPTLEAWARSTLSEK
jgi:hypothetical protein